MNDWATEWMTEWIVERVSYSFMLKYVGVCLAFCYAAYLATCLLAAAAAPQLLLLIIKKI